MEQAANGQWWLAEVEAIVGGLVEEKADVKKQQETWNWVGRTFGLEAMALAKKLCAEWQAEKIEEGGASFRDEKPNDTEQPPILSNSSPYDSAKEFARRYCFKEGVLSVCWYQGEFWEWNGRCYRKMGADTISRLVWDFLDEAKSRHGNDTKKLLFKPNDVENVIKGLKAGLTIDLDPPCWVDGKPAGNLLVFQNGLVDVDTGKMLTPTPRLWINQELDFDYDPDARCPMWDRWLNEVFPNDVETQECIEEQLGYGMTSDVKFQKAFLWVGRKGREGKGTLAHVLKQLCGPSAYAGLSFHDWLKGEYSKEALMGKKVGCFPDVRFKEGKWYGQNYDPGGIDHVSKEEVLKISGGDPVTIRRKWKSVAWEGVLPMKLFLLSNRIPVLNDTILASRFIHIAFNVSFLGREDVTIPKRLEAELPGIANRCLRAYRRLCERGRFTQPKSGLELAKEVNRSTNPYQAFAEDRCVLERSASINPTLLLIAFHKWCEDNGRDDLLKTVTAPHHLSKQLKRYIPELSDLDTFRPHGQQRHYLGIRLKTATELHGKVEVIQLKPAVTKVRSIRRI